MFKPKKQLGQNFLKNPEIAKKIVSAAEIDKSDTIIEVGPGTGILTEELIKTEASVFAIEKDYDLIAKLQKRYNNVKNLKVVHQDVLWFDIEEFSTRLNSDKSYKVVANIPYSITSPLIRKFLENANTPKLMVIMVQKEVAERICAKPGDRSRGLLTLIVEYYADAQILFDVKRTEFYPAPTVDSAAIKITIKPNKPHRVGEDQLETKMFFKVVKAGFSSKRKQIHNSLGATLRLEKDTVISILNKSHINPSARAEDLSLNEWQELARNAILYI
jgi:16S rRNA (adenine1518-N6/adenine1519-N6)-dimethyltransferase